LAQHNDCRSLVTIVVPFVVHLNGTIVVPFVIHLKGMIVVPFVVPLNRTTFVPFTIVVPLQVLHLWRLGIENGR
jgi:hypothetical protein